jgi:hypothetical protein
MSKDFGSNASQAIEQINLMGDSHEKVSIGDWIVGHDGGVERLS